MFNNFSLSGRIAKEIRVFENEKNRVGVFTLAVQRPFKNKEDEYETDFIRIVVFNYNVEILEKYTDKGSLIGVEGRVQTSSYVNKDGEKVYTTEIVGKRIILLETKEQREKRKENKELEKVDSYSEDENDSYDNYLTNIQDDDLPF
ncbi:single-stranded DNA-binding protein [Nosocomiicoccus massiliensis]|uniref:single-stranded DNA-binding protein n=1 Tax=Nosocomiicoccus massiliensis TaxID=1232430 RepID=UPI0004177B05|nr:single-stranded DNA-binding protein [Nosocomiicoccus massiliensis]